MKLHKNLIDAVVSCLQQIFNEKKYADKVIEKVLASDRRWGARDRAFVAENTYEMVRWWRLISYIATGSDQAYEQEIDEAKAWHLFGVWLLLSGRELPVWREFAAISIPEAQNRAKYADGIRKLRESVPDWMDNIGEKELGKQWAPELKALNQYAPVVIRANTLKTTKTRLSRLLYDEGIETVPAKDAEDALVLKRRANLFRSLHFKSGLFEVQDASSQQVAAFMQLEPGMRVIDACAGAGGKTLHIAALMENKGRIISLDTEQWKLDELKKRARRNGATIIETKLIDSNKVIKRLYNTADRLLLDVPCSGLGVLRRNPDAKWKLSEEFVNRIRGVQAEIISGYSAMLKPGGIMVYATCSVLPSENEEQVQRFLESNSGFTLLDQRRISAGEGFDGFFMARLQKSKDETKQD